MSGLQTRLASARMGMGDVEAAMGDLEHTLQLVPKAPAVGEALFFASLASGDMDKAQEALDKVKAMQGDYQITGNLEGLLHIARTELPEAKASFEGLIQKYPDFAPAKSTSRGSWPCWAINLRRRRCWRKFWPRIRLSEPALTMSVFY